MFELTFFMNRLLKITLRLRCLNRSLNTYKQEFILYTSIFWIFQFLSAEQFNWITQRKFSYTEILILNIFIRFKNDFDCVLCNNFDCFYSSSVFWKKKVLQIFGKYSWWKNLRYPGSWTIIYFQGWRRLRLQLNIFKSLQVKNIKPKLGRFNLLNEMCFKYPKAFKVWLGPSMLWVLVNDPRMIQKILLSPVCLEKPFFYKFFRLSSGLISSKREFYFRQVCFKI